MREPSKSDLFQGNLSFKYKPKPVTVDKHTHTQVIMLLVAVEVNQFSWLLLSFETALQLALLFLVIRFLLLGWSRLEEPRSEEIFPRHVSKPERDLEKFV